MKTPCKVPQFEESSLFWRSTGVPSPLAQVKAGGGNPDAVQGRETATPTNTRRSDVGSVVIVGGVTRERKRWREERSG